MSELDRMIEEALDAEDRALLDKYGEQGLFKQVGGLFRGKTAWWTIMVGAIQVILFVGAVIAALAFLRADEISQMLRWGGLSGLLMMAVGIIKLMLFMRMQTNDVLREVKRVELQIVRRQSRGDD